MEKPLVSIGCITYNHEKFISQTLEGFLMQKTNFPVEIFINDDCSTDKTPEILRAYEKKYPGIFQITYQTENQLSKGVKPLSQLILPRIRGKFVALCEGDDYWTDPLKLQKQADFLLQNPEYALCFHPAKIVDENNEEIESVFFKHLREKDYTVEEILETWSIPTASSMFRADIAPYITQMSKTKRYFYGDTPMFLTILQHGKAHCMGETMSVYRVHKGGVSKEKTPRKFNRVYSDYKKIKDDFGGKYRNLMIKNLARTSFSATVTLIREGYFWHGIKFLLISLRYDRQPLFSYLSRKWKELRPRKTYH